MMEQEPEEGLVNEKGIEPTITEKENIETLKQALTEEREKAARYLANWQRAQADFMNYKRFSAQEREDISQLTKSTLVFVLLPILDDLERAFTLIPPELANLSWTEGIEFIGRKLRTGLEAQGLALIKVVGEPFDPRLHEAVRQAKGQEGIIIDEVQKGYTFQGKVIRPSKVVVGNGEEGN